MATIYLHIGRGKTGTTPIQEYLSAQKPALASQGVHYLWADDHGSGRGHQNFAKSFVTKAPEFMLPAAEPERVRREVAEEIESSSAPLILISSENFAIAEPSAVREFFRSLAVSHVVRVVFFVRSQDEVAESEYNQVVKIGKISCSFTEYVRAELEGCDYMETATNWECHFGRENLICRVYDAARRNVVMDYLSSIGIAIPEEARRGAELLQRSAVNASIGIRAVTVARILNSIDLPNRDNLYQQIFARVAEHDLPALLFDSDEARAFRARFAESNRAFTKRFLGAGREDLGGRRYTDRQRDQIRREIRALGMN